MQKVCKRRPFSLLRTALLFLVASPAWCAGAIIDLSGPKQVLGILVGFALLVAAAILIVRVAYSWVGYRHGGGENASEFVRNLVIAIAGCVAIAYAGVWVAGITGIYVPVTQQ